VTTNRDITRDLYDAIADANGGRVDVQALIDALEHQIVFDAGAARRTAAEKLVKLEDERRTKRAPANQLALNIAPRDDEFLVIGRNRRVRGTGALWEDIEANLQIERENVNNVVAAFQATEVRALKLSPYMRQGLTWAQAAAAYDRDARAANRHAISTHVQQPGP